MKTFASFLLVFLLSYSPVFFVSFAASDDYGAVATSIRGKSAIASGLLSHVSWSEISFLLVKDISGLVYLRIVSVVGIALLAWCLHRTLMLVGWSWLESFVTSIIAFTMPPFQVYASWAVTAFYPFAAILSAAAVLLLERMFSAAAESRWHRHGYAIGSILLMVVALSIYQPAAMFFWVFAAVMLFRPGAPLRSVVSRFCWYNVITFVSLISWFLLSSSFKMADDAWIKIEWFLQEPLTNALNLSMLSSQAWLAVTIGILLIVGLLFYLKGSNRERFTQLLIAISILPLSYLPNLIIAESWSSYRTLSALTSIIVVYAFFSLSRYMQFLRRVMDVPPIVGVIAAFICCLWAANNVRAYFARPLSIELQWMRSQIDTKDLSTARSIYVIPSSWQDSIAPAVRYDEFGFPFSTQRYALEPAVYLLLREVRPEKAGLPIEIAPVDGSIKPPFDALLVDMRRLKYAE